MEKKFFSSKEAASLAGCTQRQLQYWREKGIVVPTVDATGTGRSIYYSLAEVAQLATIGYCLGLGVNLDVATATLRSLQQQSADLIGVISECWLVGWDGNGVLELVEYDRDVAIDWLNDRKLVFTLSVNLQL
jgi:DNA-binding transcriptional MerR regulator